MLSGRRVTTSDNVITEPLTKARLIIERQFLLMFLFQNSHTDVCVEGKIGTSKKGIPSFLDFGT